MPKPFIIPDPVPNPETFELSQIEYHYLEQVSEPLFNEINEKYSWATRFSSDEILVLVILYIRHNDNKFPTLAELLKNIIPNNIIVPN